MSRLVSLTRPITSRSAAGTLFPWERPYSTEPIATLSHNGANLFHIDMSPAASTRLLSRRVADPSAPSLLEIDPARFLNRTADVARLDAAAGEAISAERLAAALAASADEPASALILLTGPDGGAHDFDNAPHFGDEAAELLCHELSERGVDLMLTDLPYLVAPRSTNVGRDWLGVPPWFRPSWPSPSATAYLTHHYDRPRALEDWAPTVNVLARACLVLGLSGADALDGARAVVNVAALQVRDVGEAPCTVVAELVDD
ncbi:MAG TPA: hypothetical protein VFU12_17190 [Glycomyces sp.]|nr:hypothetical protein [Glycomyces sp.]